MRQTVANTAREPAPGLAPQSANRNGRLLIAPAVEGDIAARLGTFVALSSGRDKSLRQYSLARRYYNCTRCHYK